MLEERWVREEGYFKIVPAAVSAALEDAKLDIGEIHRIVLPASSGTIRGLAKKLKTDANLFSDPLNANCGDSGAAHPGATGQSAAGGDGRQRAGRLLRPSQQRHTDGDENY